MRFVCVSYHPVYSCKTPDEWFESVPFYHGYLEALTDYFEVHDVAVIGCKASVHRNKVHYHFPGFNRWQMNFPWRMNNYIRQLQPDIVLIHGAMFPIQVIHLRKILGPSVKIIVQHHAEQPLTGWRSAVFQKADTYINAYFFATLSMAEPWITRHLIAGMEKVHAIPEASSVFSSAQQAEKVPDRFLWVGRLNANKDPLTVIDAFSRYAAQVPRGELYMIYQEDDLLPEVKSRIEKTGTATKIILLGKLSRSEMLHWYNTSCFIICSSYYEGCNISVLEGMSRGCIPIVTNIASFDLHTNNGKIGLRFGPGNSDELVDRLKTTQLIDEEAARSTVLRYFEAHLSFTAIARKIYNAMEPAVDGTT